MLPPAKVCRSWAACASPGVTGHNERDSYRLNRVFEFVMQEFHREIRIAEVADLIHMSETAFSRYFRQRTRKTTWQALQENWLELAVP